MRLLSRVVGATVATAVGAAVGAATAKYAYRQLTRSESAAATLVRTNHRGDTVTLAQGPALVLGAAVGALAAPSVSWSQRTAVTLATIGSGGLGAYDDLFGDSSTKGLRGHLTAACQGEITSGFIKLVGIASTGVIAGTLARRGRGGLVDGVLSGVVIAGSANLLNLLDLRPGRATKVFVATALPYLFTGAGSALAGSLGAAVAMVPHDLSEDSMMGDAGANALGAAWGVSAVAGMSRTSLLVTAGGIGGLTLLSENVSFSDLIEANPTLRAIDEFGRPTPS